MPTPPAATRKARLEFIDLLRGLAVVVMIETHTTNALLAAPFRAMGWFGFLDFANGLVAPSFLFCAGCGLWISLGRRWDDYLALRRPLWVYLRRLGWILGVAYALHLPNFSLRQMIAALSPSDVENLFQVDVLHVIVTTLVFVVAVAIVTRSRRAVLWTAIILSLAEIVSVPTVWTFARSAALSSPVRDMLTETPRSYFPFIPWTAFVFIGMVVTNLYMTAQDKDAFFRKLFICGAALTGIGTVMMFVYNPWPSDLWRATPIFFAMRLGIVWMAFALLYRYTVRRKDRPLSQHGLLLVFGRESLLIYVTHLIIVYGSVVNNGIAASLAGSFAPVSCLAVTVGLIALMYLEVRIWMMMKSSVPRLSAAIPYVWAVLFLAFLITNK